MMISLMRSPLWLWSYKTSASPKVTAVDKSAPVDAVHEDVAVFDRAAEAIASGALTGEAAVRQIVETAVRQQMPDLPEAAQQAVAARLEAMVLAEPELASQIDQLLA